MAKFCGNCGTQLEDNAKICGKCGTPLDGAAVNIPGLKTTDPEKLKKVKRVVKLVVGLVALVIVASIVFNVVTQYTGYNGLLRKVMGAYENYDIDTLVSLSSDMYYYGEDEWAESYFEQAVGGDLNYFESSVGHSYKMSYEVKETYTLPERKVDELLNQVELTYTDFDISVIEKIVVADVIITAKQGEYSTELSRDIVMTKEGGSWKLLYMEYLS